MPTPSQLNITLPSDIADMLRSKVATGEYANESEVIREGLNALIAREREVENWLSEEVGPAFDAIKTDPSRAISVEQMRGHLAALHKAGIDKN